MKRFQVNVEYTARSICDYDCVFRFRISRRTEKNVWVYGESLDKPTRRAVKRDGEGEYILPLGNYSMAPMLRA
jgi:hypothetical protein